MRKKAKKTKVKWLTWKVDKFISGPKGKDDTFEVVFTKKKKPELATRHDLETQISKKTP
jgi:hypothetical protein